MPATAADIMAPVAAEMSRNGENERCTSSSEKTMPDSGAENAAERPAAAPAVVRQLSSSPPFLEIPLTACPAHAPICTQGPSRPSDSPNSAPSSPPRKRTTRIDHQRIFKTSESTPSVWGMPEPDAIGSQVMSFQITSPASTAAQTMPASASGSVPAKP